jgi:hypothetical protein
VRWIIADPRDSVFDASEECFDPREPPIISRDALDFIGGRHVLEHLRGGPERLRGSFPLRFHK